MQICTFLWVYYGYPASSYEGINVETVRYRFLNFSTSRSTLDLAGRKAIAQLEPHNGDRHLDEYATAGSERQRALVETIRRQLHLTSLAYQDMDRLVAAAGLPKEKLCTHCWDGSSFG
jgi:amidophosphoribosyltransferase